MATTIHSLAYKITADTVGMTRGLTATRKEFAAAKRQMKETETPLERFKRQVRESATLLGKGAISVEQHRRKVEKLEESYRNATKPVSKFGTALSGVSKLFAAGAIIDGARRVATANLDFQKAMARSTAIMSNVNAALRSEMESTAKTLSGQTIFSAKELAEAYFFLASAGLDAKQSVNSLGTVAKFAQAGYFDLSLATDLLTDAQSALGLSSKDTAINLAQMTRVSDVLVRANTLANASVQQFSEALTNKAGASLRLVNKQIEEGVAVLAAFADQGLKGAEAGTALGIVLRDLQTKAIKNKEAWKSLGVNVFDASGKMNNMADIVGELEVALAGMSAEQKKATFIALGLSDKSSQYLATLIGTSEKIREYEASLKSAGGTTEDVAEKNIPKLQKSLNKLTGAWDKFTSSTLVTTGLDNVAESLDKISNILDSFGAKGGEKLVQFADSYSAFLVDLASKASGERLSGGTFIRGDVENVRQSVGRAFAGDGRFAPYTVNGKSDPAIEGVQKSVEKSREDANRNAANIADRLDRLTDVTRATSNANTVTEASVPGSR